MTRRWEVLSQLNQDINWQGCDFTLYSGGCSPLISIGQCIRVPLPTAVPTASPTASGNETATPTPTYEPARMVYPPNNAIAPAGVFDLRWASVGILQADEVYLVEVEDTTSSTRWSDATRQTSVRVPASIIPSDGTTHDMRWRVTIARQIDASRVEPIGGTGSWRLFTWRSR